MYKKYSFNVWIRKVKNFNCMAHFKQFCSKNKDYENYCKEQYSQYLTEVEN